MGDSILEPKRYERAFEALYTATAALLTTSELEDLLSQILGATLRAIPKAEKGRIMLTDQATGQLQIRAWLGYRDPQVQIGAVVGAGDYAVRAVQERKPLLIADTRADAAQPEGLDIPEIREVLSAIVAPLTLNQQVIGALSVGATRPAVFTEADLRLLEAFATAANIAVRTAQLHAQVQSSVITDAITGLYNRRGFFELSRREVEHARRYRRPLTAIMLDLDHFKQVNDTYGYAGGDQVLAGVAARCRQVLRKVDLLGRYGGDEFVILLPETDIANARRVAERLRQSIQQTPLDTDWGPISITTSLGIARLDEKNPYLHVLLDSADQALHAAKAAGHNCIVIWDVET